MYKGQRAFLEGGFRQKFRVYEQEEQIDCIEAYVHSSEMFLSSEDKKIGLAVNSSLGNASDNIAQFAEMQNGEELIPFLTGEIQDRCSE